jgi:hypothetical protein
MSAAQNNRQGDNAVVDGPVRTMVVSGTIAKSENDLRERITSAVGLLLNGCRDQTAQRG